MSESPEIAIARAADALRSARAAVAAEISAYPSPIAGCDAQFNHLLALRVRIGRALEALELDVFVPTPRMPQPGSGVESR